jgi:hypothetical protein
MPTAEDKAAARALREVANMYDAVHAGCGVRKVDVLRKRADELDPPPPPKSKADRILEKFDACGWIKPAQYDLRRILKEEGID